MKNLIGVGQDLDLVLHLVLDPVLDQIQILEKSTKRKNAKNGVTTKTTMTLTMMTWN